MSVMIKGSIMPLMCGDCPCYDGSDYACNATGRGVIEYRYDGRPDNCPLVEIPTPHGRLIDADALRKTIESIYGGALWTFDCFVCIHQAPTIIETEKGDENV